VSAHSTCTHAQTPQARRTCRELRHMIAYAEKLGVKVKNTSDEYCAQVSFVEPEDRWYSTKLIWTRPWSANTYRYAVWFATGKERVERGKRGMEIWLTVLAPTERRREAMGL
jgi:hypothetical protein